MSTGPNRSTQEQMHLRECMKALFAIYNDVISKTKSTDLTPPFLQAEITALLQLIFRKEFSHDEEDNPNLFLAEPCKKSIARKDIMTGHVDRGLECTDFGTDVLVSEEELRKIPELISILMNDIQNGKNHHFVLESESKIIENSITTPPNHDDPKKREFIGTTENIDAAQEISFSQDLNWNEITKRKKSVEKALKHLKERCSYTGHEYSIISTYVRYFSVSPITEFAQAIMQLDSCYSEIDDGFLVPENCIPSIDTLGQYTKISLLDVVKSLFVHFHVNHVDFKNIKVCEYDQCQNFMVEIQVGQKRFCSPGCKTKYNNSIDDPEKRKCRTRQNKYLERYIDRMSHTEKAVGRSSVLKYDCEKCEIPPGLKGGSCPKLKEKNAILSEEPS